MRQAEADAQEKASLRCRAEGKGQGLSEAGWEQGQASCVNIGGTRVVEGWGENHGAT